LGPAVLVGPLGLEPPLGTQLLPEPPVERPAVGVLLEIPLEPLVLSRELLLEPRPHLVAECLEPGRGPERDIHPAPSASAVLDQAPDRAARVHVGVPLVDLRER